MAASPRMWCDINSNNQLNMKKNNRNRNANNFAEYIQVLLQMKGLHLGEIALTKGVSQFCDDDLELVLKIFEKGYESGLVYAFDIIFSAVLRHAKGDYGLISKDEIDCRSNSESRTAGGCFISLYQFGREYIKVVTNPLMNRTTVCFGSED